MLLLAASLGLNAFGIDWGLPSRHGWAPDEVVPGDVLEGMARRFSGGWHTKYPPLQYYLLAGLYAPMLAPHPPSRPAGPGTPPSSADGAAAAARFAPAVSDAVYFHLFLTSRGLSLLMGAGLLLAVFFAGRALAGAAAGLGAAALVATMPPFAFYAKLANLDVPALFWWALSLVFLLRLLKQHRPVDYVLFAATAVAAVCTKDQTYGLYILCVPWILTSRARHDGRPGLVGALRAAFRPEALTAAAVAAASFAVIHNLAWNAAGFRAHVGLITGSASRDFREFSGDVSGHLSLLAQTGANLGFSLGWPAFAVCLVGLALAVRGRQGPWPPLSALVPGLSYCLFFLSVVLYSYDRFVLPLAILLAFFGGAALARGWSVQGPARLVARAAIVCLLAYGFGRCLSLDLALRNDARYAAEDWLKRSAGPGAAVAAVGPLEYLPRMDGLDWRPLGPSLARLERVRPTFVVVNADYAQRADEGTGEHDFYAGLERGELGYRLALKHRFEAPWLLLRTQSLVERPGALVRSNIGKVNPEVRIYRAPDPLLVP